MRDRPAAPRRARRAPFARAPFVRLVPLAALLAACGLAPGCGIFDPGKEPPRRRPEILPLNDTPRGAMLRLVAAYENQDLVNYVGLLTSDFRYTFSAQSDPALATLYGDSWGKDDEAESAQHLFQGFTNEKGEVVPGASDIRAQLVNDQYYPDPAHADSALYYEFCPVTNVQLTIDVPNDAGGTTYNISAPHQFFLVRGDAALLDPGQTADSTRWYVRHWDDLSPALPGAFAPPPGGATSWGGVRGAYER